MYNKVVTVVEINEQDNRIGIKDQEGKWHSFFKTKQDGAHSKAFEAYATIPVKENATVELSLKQNGKYSNVMNIRPTQKTNDQPFYDKKEVGDKEEQKWEKIREEKNDSISWMNAKNNATLLLAYKVYPVQNGNVVGTIQKLASEIHLLEPMESMSPEEIEEDFNPDNVEF